MTFPTRPDWKEGIEELKLAPPTTTFTDKMTYRYGDLEIQLVYNGPAHTMGDAQIYLPRYKVLFAGDVAFHHVAPHFWQGHGSELLRVLDWIKDLDVKTIVPGHGPIETKKEIPEMREYVETLKREAKKRFEAGMTAVEASVDINMGRFDDWPTRRNECRQRHAFLYGVSGNAARNHRPKRDTKGARELPRTQRDCFDKLSMNGYHQ